MIRNICVNTCILFALLLQIFSVEAKEIHSFIVADTYSNLKKGVRMDATTMNKLVTNISNATRIPLANLVLTQQGLTRNALLNSVQNRQMNSDDIVIFYYTGHGFRTPETKQIWPYIHISKTGESVDITELTNMLLAKGASFYLILADCCNNLVQVPLDPDYHYKAKAMSPQKTELRRTLRALFSQTNLAIIASGATPGNLSWTSDKGSIFTNALISSLSTESKQETSDWNRVLQRTLDICKKYQTAQYLILPLETKTDTEAQ